MHSKLIAAAFALGSLAAAAAPALGQTPPPPPYDPHPVLSADLGLGGPGQFSAVDDTGKGELCYMLVAPIPDATGAFIGDGKTNQSVLALQPPVKGTSGACVQIWPDLAKKLVDHASDYSVYVKSAMYPGGHAASARLSAQIPDKPIG